MSRATADTVAGDHWSPPRCGHGHILLGCPHDDCEAQNAYLDAQREAQENARRQLDETARRMFSARTPRRTI